MIAEFATVWRHADMLRDGFLNTALLAVVAALGSLLLGALLAPALMSRRRTAQRLATVLVDVMRCVPFLLFAYIVYYGLPSLGVQMDNWTSGLLALILYNAAYMAELIRAAWSGLPQEQIEAGAAFGFHGFGLFRRVILPPVVLAAMPMLGNQIIQIIKDSAFLTIIAVRELTHEAAAIQSQYFVPFGSFLVALGLYWVLCLLVESGVGLTGRHAEARR
jgi:polar amino acid transport system permease protein